MPVQLNYQRLFFAALMLFTFSSTAWSQSGETLRAAMIDDETEEILNSEDSRDAEFDWSRQSPQVDSAYYDTKYDNGYTSDRVFDVNAYGGDWDYGWYDDYSYVNDWYYTDSWYEDDGVFDEWYYD